jgi:hypothetical protein
LMLMQDFSPIWRQREFGGVVSAEYRWVSMCPVGSHPTAHPTAIGEGVVGRSRDMRGPTPGLRGGLRGPFQPHRRHRDPAQEVLPVT